jgi:serine/threonine-protein kinase
VRPEEHDEHSERDEIERFVGLGSVLSGKYRIERVLGAGGMGVVVAARHLQLGETVAIKFLLPKALGKRRSAQRFLREARASSRLKGAHVVRVYDTDVRDDGAPFIVMEFLEGESLAARLSRDGAFPVTEAVDLLLEAGTALAEAHARGIVHRDLKPANLFLAHSAGELSQLKVLDFGISKLLEPTDEVDRTTGDNVMGSPPYMSPEQLLTPTMVDRRTDIWALGTIAFELLTGQALFTGATFAEISSRILQFEPARLAERAPELTPELVAVIQRCLAREPGQRFADIQSWANALAPFGSEHAQAVQRLIAALSTTAPPRASESAPPDGLRSAAGATATATAPASASVRDTGTLTAAASRAPTRPAGANRLVILVGLTIGVGVTWPLVRSLMSSGRNETRSVASTQPVTIPSAPPPLASEMSAPRPPSASASSSAPAATASVAPRATTKVKHVAGLAPPSVNAPSEALPALPSGRPVDRVFGERR